MTHSVSTTDRSPITIAAGFLGAFVVGSLAVQLIHSQTQHQQAPSAGVEPVVASPATLWTGLGDRDLSVKITTATVAAPQANVEPVVGSEATLWSTLGER